MTERRERKTDKRQRDTHIPDRKTESEKSERRERQEKERRKRRRGEREEGRGKRKMKDTVMKEKGGKRFTCNWRYIRRRMETGTEKELGQGGRGGGNENERIR